MAENYLRDYAELIRTGQVIVGRYIRREIENLIADLDDPRYVYDTEAAHKRIRFMERCCLQSKAPYYMQPLKLMPWQKAWFEAIYSFRMADTGKRRFTEGLLEIARKNGKSSMLAADATYDLFVGPKGADIVCASVDDKAAKQIWKEVAGMRSRLDPHKRITGQNLVELTNPSRNTTVFRLSSRANNLDGYNISVTYMDESHDVSEEEGQCKLAEACWRGMSSKDEPLFINCTTQGFNRDCYLDRKISHAKAVIDGEAEDDRLLPFLYEQDSEQEIWQDESLWEKSNPAIRYGIKKIDKLRRDVELAKTDKATRVHLLTKDFNIVQATAQGWMMLDDYVYDMAAFDLEDFRGAYALGAVDLSATTDLSCAMIMMMRPGDRTKYVFSQYFIPKSKLDKSDDRAAGAAYKEWARAGLVTIHDGDEVDIAAVADWFLNLYKEFGIRPYKVGYDQRYAKDFIDRMRFDIEMLAQGRALSNAMKLTEAELKGRVINYNNNAVDRWCLGNCCIEVDNVGNVQPVKVKSQPYKRIDGAVTMIMLEEMYRRYRSDFNKLIGG